MLAFQNPSNGILEICFEDPPKLCAYFCKSRKSAERTLKNIIPFIEGKLFLKVNRKKTEVAHISNVKYLGYTFYRYKSKCRFRVHQKSVAKMKNKIRELTDRNKGISNAVREKVEKVIGEWRKS